jgi:hypothetical protein
MGKKGLKIVLISVGSILLILALAALFFVRFPLLIVTDNEFVGLYGVRRTVLKEWETGIRLFRRVKNVPVADGSAPDVVAFAVESAAKKPFAVIFPYRYEEGARLYAAQSPEIPVAVQTGTAEIRNPADGILYVGTDKRTDLYRAGLFAAAFARQNNGGVLFFEGNSVVPGDRAAFSEGTRRGGYENTPTFLSAAIEFEPHSSFACAVIEGTPVFFLGKNPEMPMIVFSWMDPAHTSQAVKVIFDDSPWALALPLAEVLAGKAAPAALPSGIIAPKDRVGDEELWQNIEKIIRDNERYE